MKNKVFSKYDSIVFVVMNDVVMFIHQKWPCFVTLRGGSVGVTYWGVVFNGYWFDSPQDY